MNTKPLIDDDDDEPTWTYAIPVPHCPTLDEIEREYPGGADNEALWELDIDLEDE